MRETIPDGIYNTLWSWVEASRAKKLDDHFLQQVLYLEDTIDLKKAIGFDAQEHPNFHEKSVTIPKAFVGVLPEGRYWMADDRTISVITPDNKLVWDVSMQYHLPNARHPIFHKADLPQAEYTAETVAVLTYAFDDNYHHWLIEVLGRIHLLNKSGIHIDKYLINGKGSPAFQAESLSLLGIPEHKIIQSKRGMHLRAKRLVVPSLNVYSLLPFIPNAPAKWAVQFLRSELMSRVQQDRMKEYKRIYISRRDAKHRTVTNEKDIMEILKANGFQVVAPGHMSVVEQIRMFASADLIIAPHGAGLANLIFCQPGARVLELFSPNYVNPLFWYMSNLIGLDYYYLIGQGERLPIDSGFGDVGYRIEPITIDVKAFSNMLNRIGAKE